MSEERMICVWRQSEGDDSYDRLSQPFRWIPVEPAPPKDWVPDCHDGCGIVKTCFGRKGEGYNSWKKSCQQCPYRKKEDTMKEYLNQICE